MEKVKLAIITAAVCGLVGCATVANTPEGVGKNGSLPAARIVNSFATGTFVREANGTKQRRLLDFDSRFPSWSPDGEYIVFDSDQLSERNLPGGDKKSAIFKMRKDGSDIVLLTLEQDEAQYPAWSPDGATIAFESHRAIHTMSPDGTELATILMDDNVIFESSAWSKDGSKLAVLGYRNETDPKKPMRDLFTCNADGTDLTIVAHLALPAFDNMQAAWSPDGKRIGLLVHSPRPTGGPATSYYLLDADGSSMPKAVGSIPDSWFPWYWPQWGDGK